MITKKELRNIIKNELLPLKLNLLESEKILKRKNIFEKDYQLENYYDTHFLNITNVFYKLNAVLINIKYKLLSNKSVKTIEKIETVFGKKNGNNVYNLFTFIEKESGIIFEPHFVYYCVVVETLVRHQYSHGFGKSLLYLGDGHQTALLFHNYKRWNKYKNIEGNENAFFSINLSYLNDSDYFYCNYFNNSFSILLNSRSARTVMQFKWVDLKQNRNVPSDYLVKQRNKNKVLHGNYIDKITLHKYNEKWININNQKIENILMFPNSNCDHNKIKKCYVCNIIDNLPYQFTPKSKEELTIKIVSKNNKKRCIEFFSSIMKNKLSHFKLKAIGINEYNEYFINIMEDIFGQNVEKDYYEIFNNKTKEKLEQIYNEIFTEFMKDGKTKQFVCYRFDENYIPLARRVFSPHVSPTVKTNFEDFFSESTYDLSINYKIFLNEIKKNFISFYKQLK